MLLGLAKRVALIAERVLGIKRITGELAYTQTDNEVTIELLPVSRFRKQPLLISVCDHKIEIRNVLYNLDRVLDGIKDHLKNFKNMRGESFNVNYTLENGSLSIEVKYKPDISLLSMDELTKKIFGEIRSMWKEVLSKFHEYAIENFGMFTIEFLGSTLTIVPFKLDEVKDDVSKAWFPGPIITMPDETGMFLNSAVGIDFLNFPLLSTIIDKGDHKEYVVHYFTENMNVNSLSINDVANLFSVALKMLEKYRPKVYMALSKIIQNPKVLAEDIKLWDKLISELREILWESNRNNVPLKIKPIRPNIISNGDNSENLHKFGNGIKLTEDDRKEIINVLSKLESIYSLIKLAQDESRIFTNMVIGRLIASILARYNKPEIVYGELEKETRKNIRKTKSSATLSINLNDLGLSNIPSKALIKVVRNNSKRYIVIEL